MSYRLLREMRKDKVRGLLVYFIMLNMIEKLKRNEQ